MAPTKNVIGDTEGRRPSISTSKRQKFHLAGVKTIINKLLVTTFLSGSLILGSQFVPIVSHSNTLRYQEDVSDDMTLPLETALNKSDHNPFLLTITSDGGEVFSKAMQVAAMESHGNVDTFVPFMAASAASQLWLHGNRRFVQKGAVILFHGASVGEGVTAPQIRRDVALGHIPAEKAEAILSVLDGLNEGMVSEFDEIIAQSGGKLTREIIKQELFHNFEHDIFTPAEKLMKMGIATDLGGPNVEKYKEFNFLNILLAFLRI